MTGGSGDSSRIRFGAFELDLESGELRKSGVLTHLPPQPVKVLALLAARAGQLVSREEIRQQVWGDETFVDFEHGLNQCIKQIRTAVGDDADDPRYIQTLPRRGYRFIAPPEGAGGAVSPAAQAERPVAAVAEAGGTWRRLLWPWVIAVPILAGIGAVILLIFNVAGLRGRLLPTPALARIESIAVLPLENLSRDPEQEYFADGMTDALITNLGQIRMLRVISRQSIMRYKGSKTPLPEIARELNVDAIVEGTVQRSGDRVRITAQLLHGKTDRHLWAESYERDFRDMLKLQSEVAQAIAREIRITVTPEERKRMEESRQVNPEAYRLYLQGRYQCSKRTRAGFEKSTQLFRQALEKDPGSALAYAGLAESYGILPFYSAATPRAAFPQARAAAQKALEIDGSLAEAHAALGHVMLWHDWDWPAAERELKHALKLKPGYADGHHRYAEYLSAMGRHEEAISEIRRAQELDPLSALMQAIGSEVFYYARRYDEGMESARKALFLDPNLGLAYDWVAHHSVQKGMYEEALKQCAEAERLARADRDVLANVAYVYAVAGKREQALSVIGQPPRQKGREKISPFQIARAYLGLGEKDLALEWLEKSHEERDPYMVFMNVDPRWDTLRAAPRFQDLLRRMKFPS